MGAAALQHLWTSTTRDRCTENWVASEKQLLWLHFSLYTHETFRDCRTLNKLSTASWLCEIMCVVYDYLGTNCDAPLKKINKKKQNAYKTCKNSTKLF